MDRNSGCVTGGDEVYLLCDKVQKGELCFANCFSILVPIGLKLKVSLSYRAVRTQSSPEAVQLTNADLDEIACHHSNVVWCSSPQES